MAPQCDSASERVILTTRAVRLPADHDQLLALDRSFTTDRIYKVTHTANAFELELVVLDQPLHKTFPLADDLSEARSWAEGLVVESAEGIVGFAAFTHQHWNHRTELWHLYVAPFHRGHGVGRALVNAVVELAREVDMRGVWLETSNVAYPAIQFYRSVGFELCGLDMSLYAHEHAQETALYFMCPV